MTLQERLSQEMKSAMLTKDTDRLSTLRLLKSVIGYLLVERKTETLPDADFVGIVQKEVKKRRDAIEQYEKGGRPELAAKEKKEMGPVIKAVQTKVGARAEGKTISGIVGKLLP